MTYEEQFDHMSADEIKEILKAKQAEERITNEQAQLDKQTGMPTAEELAELPKHLRDNIMAEFNKAQASARNAVSAQKLGRAEQRLDKLCAEYMEQTGLPNVPPFKMAEFKTQLRSEGFNIW
jgi:hypothetical protein